MLFRQLFDPVTSTYSYLLADRDSREAILIDPVREQVERDVTIIEELNLELVATVETHVHADHVTGAWLLKQRFASNIVFPIRSGAEGADRLVGEGDAIRFGRFGVEVRLTPGHTDGCASYVTDDRSKVFTGDALLIRGSGRTDFQQGDARVLYRSVWDQILSLPDDTFIYPGHDYRGRTVSTVVEEKRFNPRLGDQSSEDRFVEIMNNLNLPYPKQLDRALPANLALGREGDDETQEQAPDLFGRLPRSVTGIKQVNPAWVAENSGSFRVVDVRQPDEFEGPLGHLGAAELVPLGELPNRCGAWDRDEPIVIVCRSSGRSDQAARILEAKGFRRVASMVGGMIAWNAETPVERVQQEEG